MDRRVIGHRISAAIGDQNGHVLAVVDLRPAHEGLFACGDTVASRRHLQGSLGFFGH